MAAAAPSKERARQNEEAAVAAGANQREVCRSGLLSRKREMVFESGQAKHEGPRGLPPPENSAAPR